MTFRQMNGESLYDAWEKIKDLTRKIPQHGFSDEIVQQTFYLGLYIATRSVLDAAAGGSLTNLTDEEPYQKIEDMAMSIQWEAERNPQKRVVEMHQISQHDKMAAQLEALTKKIDALSTSKVEAAEDCIGKEQSLKRMKKLWRW